KYRSRERMDMIESDACGIGDCSLAESSEQGMLWQVDRASRRDEPIVFLGWEPHPMNANFDLSYLSGGDDHFGPDFGGATVYTNVRAGYVAECPNVGKFLENLNFTLDRKSTRLNSSHVKISYAVFCLKKKKQNPLLAT